MITKLNWDTDFFGYPVGKLIIEETEKFDLEELKSLSKEFKLLYVFSKSELQLSSNNVFLADRKVIFKRIAGNIIEEDYKYIVSYREGITNQLLNLTFQSGVYSRFNTDKNFINKEFEKLYTRWIECSVDRTQAKDVFVYKIMNEILGFITLVIKNNIAEIGLVAVDNKARGKGVGSNLVKYAINAASKLGCPEIHVTTQLDNEPAVALYKNNGFIISDLTYIYHYWNK